MSYAHQSAIDFAAGRGNVERPLLHPRWSPTSQIPCADFSPWLRAQVRDGDVEAVMTYLDGVRLAVQRGTTMTVGTVSWNEETGDIDLSQTFEVPMTEEARREGDEWIAQARVEYIGEVTEMMRRAIERMEATTPTWEEDFRVASLMIRPHHELGYSTGNDGVPIFLAAAMSIHDVRPAGGPGTPFKRPPPVIATLPLGTRSHFHDIAVRMPRTVQAPAKQFSADWLNTYQFGIDLDESHQLLIDAGLLKRATDITSLEHIVKDITAPRLRELLLAAQIPVQPRDSKWANAKVALRIREQILEELGYPEILEFTAQGVRAANWIDRRVHETTPMWVRLIETRERYV